VRSLLRRRGPQRSIDSIVRDEHQLDGLGFESPPPPLFPPNTFRKNNAFSIQSLLFAKYKANFFSMFLYVWWPMPLFLETVFIFYFIYRHSMAVDEVQIYIQHFAWGLLVVLSAGCGLAAWMTFIDEFVVRFKSVEELYLLPHCELTVRTLTNFPRRRICMDNSSTSKWPVSSTVTPLYQ
jgi:hypothetical protein